MYAQGRVAEDARALARSGSSRREVERELSRIGELRRRFVGELLELVVELVRTDGRAYRTPWKARHHQRFLSDPRGEGAHHVLLVEQVPYSLLVPPLHGDDERVEKIQQAQAEPARSIQGEIEGRRVTGRVPSITIIIDRDHRPRARSTPRALHRMCTRARLEMWTTPGQRVH
jgi:hypothetical protein